MIDELLKGCFRMPSPKNPRHWFVADWLVSTEVELLESEGATPRGIAVIDELNTMYARTGALNPIRTKVVSAVHNMFHAGQKNVAVLEVGARDGALLRTIGEDLADAERPVSLHGTESRQNLVDLARTRSIGSGLQTDYSVSKDGRLDRFSDGTFDIVFSAFMLHHCSGPNLLGALTECNRVSRGWVFHLDLERSLGGVIGLWLTYTLLGARLSRHDAVLSCRRSMRRKEIAQRLAEVDPTHPARVRRVSPFRWCSETLISNAKP